MHDNILFLTQSLQSVVIKNDSLYTFMSFKTDLTSEVEATYQKNYLLLLLYIKTQIPSNIDIIQNTQKIKYKKHKVIYFKNIK